MEFDEEKFRNQAEKEISRCRPGDWSHTLRVVSWVKELGENREDLYLIIAAAYIHDIGWRGVFSKEKISIEELNALEEKANVNSNNFAREFLSQFHFSEENTRVILRLIKATDLHESASDDEKIIVDSDNLSKLSINHIKEKYKQREWIKMYEFFKEWVPKKIKTLKGKKAVPILLKKLEKQIKPG